MKSFIKQNIFIIIYSFLLSMVIFWQFIIDYNGIKLGFLTTKNLLISIPVIIGITVIIFFITRFFINKIVNINFEKRTYTKKEIKKVFLISMLFMIVVWTLCFLTYYPGGALYDTYLQIDRPIYATTQHPIGYSIIIYFFVKVLGYKIFHSALIGWVIYSIFQMLLLAFSLSFTFVFLMKRNVSLKFIIPLILIYSFIPIYATFSIYATKDVFFVLLLLYLTLLIIKIVENKDEILPKVYIYIYINWLFSYALKKKQQFNLCNSYNSFNNYLS